MNRFVKDNGDGIYMQLLQSSTTPETAIITNPQPYTSEENDPAKIVSNKIKPTALNDGFKLHEKDRLETSSSFSLLR